MDVSIVVPAYNEELRIGASIKKITDHFDRLDASWELVIVDDGSADGTTKTALEVSRSTPNVRVLTLDRNRGKGGAVREGVLASAGDLVLVSDADLATPIEAFDRLKAALAKSGCDVAIGVRRPSDPASRVRRSLVRHLSGRAFNFFVRLLLLPGCEDSQCGFKLFRREAAQELFAKQKLDGFGFDMEILFLARQLRRRVESVPVSFCDQPGSKVRMWKDGPRMVRDIFKIRAMHRTGSSRK